jgi:hypothetical protein
MTGKMDINYSETSCDLVIHIQGVSKIVGQTQEGVFHIQIKKKIYKHLSRKEFFFVV